MKVLAIGGPIDGRWITTNPRRSDRVVVPKPMEVNWGPPDPEVITSVPPDDRATYLMQRVGYQATLQDSGYKDWCACPVLLWDRIPIDEFSRSVSARNGDGAIKIIMRTWRANHGGRVAA